jgi:hypothetical protein
MVEDQLTPLHYVVLDACVLMPTILRRLLLRVAATGLYAPVWSARIGDEWRRNAARLWQMPLIDLQAEWDAMNAAWPAADPGDCTAYEVGLKYSDPKDWHVIAAGLARRARFPKQRPSRVSVMTWNLKDFNTSELRRADLTVATPDALLSHWFESDANLLIPALLPVMADALLVGRPGATLAEVLHRERLYRLAKLWAKAS